MVKKYIVTTAVNESPVHKGFWAAIQTYASHNDAEIIVVAAKYVNPTAKRGKAKQKRDAIYAPELMPFLTRKRRNLGENLTLFADLPIQATAGNPTMGLEVLCKGSSAIVGHVKRALTVVPTTNRIPRIIWSTGACTVARYSATRAGVKAKEHHVIGAVVVEVVGKRFHVRNVTATSRTGEFTDLDVVYHPDGAYEAPGALSVVLGDIHVGQDDVASLKAAKALVECVKPKHLVLHDVYDGATRSHHERSKKARFSRVLDTVEFEVKEVAAALSAFAGWKAEEVNVIASNHHDHLGRWMDEHDLEQDPINTPYWHRLWSNAYDTYTTTGKWPDTLEAECRRLDVPEKVRFLGREDSLVLAGVAHQFHGDKGINGSRGSLLGYSKLGCKVTIGHSHTCGIKDGAFQVGVTGRLEMSYNHKPSTWVQAHCVLGADGKRQMVVTVAGEFRAA